MIIYQYFNIFYLYIKIMSENYLYQITLDYLINKENFKKTLEGNKSKNANRKDKKFYRKRILSLTRDLLIFKENDEPLLPDVKNAFEAYVKTCVEYFKTLDETDIIQEDYNELEELDVLLGSISTELLEENNSIKDADNLLMRSIKVNPLDKFVKRTKFKKEEPIIPIQKEINLNEPYLKNKGISKKKNITNNYDEIYKQQEENKIQYN